MYALVMHNFAFQPRSLEPSRSSRTHLSATHAVRSALPSDAGEIHQLVSAHTEAGLLLPRSSEDIAAAIEGYVVVIDQHERVMGCAALLEYSPSLAEVGSVAVAREAQGCGLGSLVVRGVEGMARRRGIDELFAVTRADRFFASLGYAPCAIGRYPEKLAHYDRLARLGIPIVPKSCYRKLASWME